jgi:hypothetical protein
VTITVEGDCGEEHFIGYDTIIAKKYYTLELIPDLPEGIDPRDVEIRSPCLTSNWSRDNILTLSGLPEKPFIVIGVVDESPVALSFFNPDSDSNEISCLNTAVTLIMIANLLYSMPSNLIPEVIALIRGTPEVQALGDQVCQALSMNSEALLNPSFELLAAVELASEAVNDALADLLASGGNQTGS